MPFLRALIEQAQSAWTPWITLAVIVSAIAVHGSERRLRLPSFFLAIHLVTVTVASGLSLADSKLVGDLHLVAVLTGGVAGVGAIGALVFRGLIPRLKTQVPQIVQDVAIFVAVMITLLVVASRNGFNLSSIVATSAVLTAVIGLSLQDTLGNILGGVALQTDESISVGDWIKVGDVVGRVANIHWRYTAVETRNWETVVIPNSVLLKNQVIVLGRRGGQPVQWRRWVWFNVDYRFAPPDVIRAVEKALLAEPIERVAQTPAPNVQLMDFGESWARYAVRYWLTDLAVDDPTDSVVRQRIFYALTRAGITLAIPAQALFVTKESSKRRAQKQEEIEERQRAAIEHVDLFNKLPDAERQHLAESLEYAPFTKGELLTKQGAKAHWLYIIEQGECVVRVEVDGIQREVSKLHDGDFMGEMSLFTGEKRSATVIALTEVQCWKLGRDHFRHLMQRRPEIAEEVAEVLAERQVELDRVRDNLSQEAAARKLDERRHDLADRIKSFFGIGA
ncbi:MAG: mechanosensitive ion channel [Myxococcales bacterium]|nr:mechanosensitive ion channel [Myxococcales bacterium]